MRRAFQTVALMVAYGITPSQCFGPQVGHGAGSYNKRINNKYTKNVQNQLPRAADRIKTENVSPRSRLPYGLDGLGISAVAMPSPTRCFFRTTPDAEGVDFSIPAYRGPKSMASDIDMPMPMSGYGLECVSDAAAAAVAGACHRETANAQPLPPWLSLPKAHLVQRNLDGLRTAMRDSYFTENESEKVISAITMAAEGDANKVAGACEFCLILIETMEMGLSALVAAAFHFCSCVAARERSLDPRFRSDSQALQPQPQFNLPSHPYSLGPSAWDLRQHPSIASFGEHVSQIERDLAHLKRLEVVASLVAQNSGVTSQRVFPDANDAGNLRNLFLTESKDWRSLAIRSAACLYRLRGIIASADAGTHPTGSLEKRIARESMHVYAPLASRLGMQRLKNELEGAAFQILYPRQHETVSSYFSPSRDLVSRGVFGRPTQRTFSHDSPRTTPQEEDMVYRMERVLEAVKEEMEEMLDKDPVFKASTENPKVTARVKHPFSLWTKMLRLRASDVLDVPDAIAFRICFNGKKNHPDEDASVTEARERALCYYAQKLCSERWLPLPGNPRFKDYVSEPKPNGYQSLHYTATADMDGEQWKMEIQVRSGKMHQVAEFGLASHWEYKARSRGAHTESPSSKCALDYDPLETKEAIGSSAAYLQSLQEWHWDQKFFSKEEQPLSEIYQPLRTASSDSAESQMRAARIRARTQQLAPYIEAFAEAQSDLSDRVFVFLSGSGDDNDGKILSLPAGAMVTDAIREYQQCSGIRNISLDEAVAVNGVPVGMSRMLRNGDILSVPCLAPSMAV